jgi:alkanesulfonate monooxygenase
MPTPGVPIRSETLDAVEVSWFSALCSDDYEFLGQPDGALRSSWVHCRDLVLAAERAGFNNILLPNGYIPGQDTLTFAGGMAALARDISLLVAVRCGEYHPPMLARAIASLDHMLLGRLNINIISSDMPGTVLESERRYQRSREVIEILKQCWTRERLEFRGEFYASEPGGASAESASLPTCWRYRSGPRKCRKPNPATRSATPAIDTAR